eukprot:1140949-Pelagomonas_calceolata.AAC.3
MREHTQKSALEKLLLGQHQQTNGGLPTRQGQRQCPTFSPLTLCTWIPTNLSHTPGPPGCILAHRRSTRDDSTHARLEQPAEPASCWELDSCPVNELGHKLVPPKQSTSKGSNRNARGSHESVTE